MTVGDDITSRDKMTVWEKMGDGITVISKLLLGTK